MVNSSLIDPPIFSCLPFMRQKCDGAKPACQQCVRAKKSDVCEYDDGKGKTRTQLMREHIQQLEMRIKELESTEHRHSPSVTLFDPHAPSPYLSESSSSSGQGSPGPYAVSASASPVPFPLGKRHLSSTQFISINLPNSEPPAWEDQWGSMTVRVSAGTTRRAIRPSISSPDFGAAQLSESYTEEPPFELAQML